MKRNSFVSSGCNRSAAAGIPDLPRFLRLFVNRSRPVRRRSSRGAGALSVQAGKIGPMSTPEAEPTPATAAPGARDEHRRAGRGDRGRALALLRPRQPDPRRRRLRPADAARSRRSRTSSPSCAPPTRRPRRSGERSRPSSPRSTTCGGWRASTTRSPTTSSSAWHARLARDGVDDPALLCELKVDGLAINLLYEDGRLVRALTRGDGTHRRGRHAQRRAPSTSVPDRLTGTDEFPVPDLIEVRGEVFLPGRGVRAAQRVDDRGRQAGLRQPAQRRRRVAAPEGPAGHRDPRARHGLPRHRRAAQGFEPQAQSHAYEALAAWGLPISSEVRVLGYPDGGRGLHRARRRAPPHDRALRDRRRRGQGRRRVAAAAPRLDQPGARGGRSRSSTRPRRSTPSCSRSGSTSAAPAGSRRTASWSRPGSPARPSRTPPSTTPTRSSARTSGPATP